MVDEGIDRICSNICVQRRASAHYTDLSFGTPPRLRLKRRTCISALRYRPCQLLLIIVGVTEVWVANTLSLVRFHTPVVRPQIKLPLQEHLHVPWPRPWPRSSIRNRPDHTLIMHLLSQGTMGGITLRMAHEEYCYASRTSSWPTCRSCIPVSEICTFLVASQETKHRESHVGGLCSLKSK